MWTVSDLRSCRTFFKREGKEKENNRNLSVKEQLDKTKMQAAQAGKRENVQKKTPERS